jgi:adenosine deaminase
MALTSIPTPEQIKRLPKAVIHDHLDGGLRPETIIELAREINYALPANEPEALADWFYEACNSGSLVRYIETFEHRLP